MTAVETQSQPRIIQVDALARVEGEGALYVRVKDNVIQDLKFRIYEPPRFFEALLRGRMFTDAPDITARICGICPIAYTTGASHAMEAALGVDELPAPLEDLRRLIYCGEWIESHVLHTYMLHAPDFLGLPDALQIAKHYPGVVERALRMKKLGNDIVDLVGGRAVHPINMKVGGFYSAPRKAKLRAMIDHLKQAIEDSLATLKLFATFTFPDFEEDYLFVALHHPDEYAIDRGTIINSRGLDIPVDAYEDHYIEDHIAHSTALHSYLKDGDNELPYHVGPLARFALNYDQLSPLCKSAAKDAGLGRVERNPFRSLLVRAVETVYAFEEALRLIEAYEEPDQPNVPLKVRAGRGSGCTEAPRGICFHRYDIDADGRILTAKIVSPTAQNQKVIESDLMGVVQRNLSLPDEQLKLLCEHSIRNYDPCISCSTHFLKLTVERE